MTAKSFCYACLGIFLLVAAWTMGARLAGADSTPRIAEVFQPVALTGVTGLNTYNSIAIDTEGRCYRHFGDEQWVLHTTVPLQGRTPLDVSGPDRNHFKVLFTNGDVMHYEYNTTPKWNDAGNIFAGTVSDAPEFPAPSWSEIKKAYREEDD